MDLARELTSLAPGAPSRVLATVGDHVVRLAVFQGDSDWHAHPETAEFFFVVEGELEMRLHGGETVTAGAGQGVLVPAGATHRPRAERRTVLLCFKTAGGPTQYFAEVAPGED